MQRTHIQSKVSFSLFVTCQNEKEREKNKEGERERVDVLFCGKRQNTSNAIVSESSFCLCVCLSPPLSPPPLLAFSSLFLLCNANRIERKIQTLKMNSCANCGFLQFLSLPPPLFLFLKQFDRNSCVVRESSKNADS